MFGNLGAFVNGNMFMGLFGTDIGLKLPEADRTRLLAEPEAGPFGPPERPMRGYVTLPAAGRHARRGAGSRRLANAAALPPKQPKRRAAK